MEILPYDNNVVDNNVVDNNVVDNHVVDNHVVDNHVVDKHRVCKDCDRLFKLKEFKVTTKTKDGLIYRSHVCKECLYTKNKGYHQNYHKIHYISRKNKKDIDLLK